MASSSCCSQPEYIEHILGAYCQTPTTMSTVQHADRLAAAQLYARGVSLRPWKNAPISAGGALADACPRPYAADPETAPGLLSGGDSKKSSNDVSTRVTSYICMTRSGDWLQCRIGDCPIILDPSTDEVSCG